MAGGRFGVRAAQHSQAGTSQREWLLLQGLARTRYGRIAIRIPLAVGGLAFVVSVIQSMPH